jgi:hypothetical protein
VSESKPLIPKPGVSLLIIFGLLVALTLFVGLWLNQQAIDFRNNLWSPAYLLVNNQSPYDIRPLYPHDPLALNPVWMPTAIGLFFPLGWLPLWLATGVWLAFNTALLLLIIYLSQNFENTGYRLAKFVLCLAGLTAFLPVFGQLKLGQYTLFTIFVFLVAAIFVNKEDYWLAGALCAVAMAKPQLAILVLPGLAIACYRAKKLQGVIFFAVGFAFAGALCTIPFWFFYPQWLTDFMSALRNNPRWLQPSLFSYFAVTENAVTFGLWLFYALGVFLFNLWLWYKKPLDTALRWSLALTALVTPYIWSWDYTLLIPLLVYTAFSLKKWQAWLVLGSGYFLGAAYMYYTFFFVTGADHVYWWTPFFLCAVAFVSQRLNRNSLYKK